jgi:hypothetical protein
VLLSRGDSVEDGNRKQYYFKNEADAVAKKNQLLYEMKLVLLCNRATAKVQRLPGTMV